MYAYGKMNFVHTVLSKRKLNWFVEENLVDGIVPLYISLNCNLFDVL